MSAKSEDDDGDSGCLLVIGAIIMALAIGHLFREEIGWLVLGGALVFFALASKVKT